MKGALKNTGYLKQLNGRAYRNNMALLASVVAKQLTPVFDTFNKTAKHSAIVFEQYADIMYILHNK